MAEGDPVELFTKYLKSEGLNITAPRKKIAAAVFEMEDHFNVTNLWAELNDDTSISMSTIYRTIDLLLDAGLLREVDLGEAHTHYEPVFQEGEHGHLVCLSCGRVMEFSSEKIEELIQEAAEERDFETRNYRLQVFGYCQDCERN